MADRIGQQLGNYQLIRLLGEGGFAEVYLGEHIHLGTQAAIKVLHTQLTSDDVDKFRTEARTIAHLIHPHIVRVLEFGVEGKTPFLVMDYAPNGTLRQRHPKGVALPLPLIFAYVKQIADALQYAHDERVIHRDIKPENMLLGRRNDILLSDFGIALVAQSSRYQSVQDMAGTMAYMAPEQIQGKPRPASDQYSLGIVVYEWLSGVRPFHGSLTELVGQHLSAPPPPLRKKVPLISSDVEHTIMRALAKEPHERFANIQAFATAFERACQPALSHQVALSAEVPPMGEPSLPSETVAAVSPTQLPQPIKPIPPLSQSLQPMGAVTPPSQLFEPAITAMPPHTSDVSSALVEESMSSEEIQPSKQNISRRTIVMGLIGLAVVGSGITWLVRSQQSQIPSFSSKLSSASPTLGRSAATRIPIGTTLLVYSGHSQPVRGVAWSPDGKRIVSGSDDYTVQVWDALTGGNVLTYRGHITSVIAVAWSPDGKYITSASGGIDSSYKFFGTSVQVWDAATGSHILTYSGHSDLVSDVAWSPNGKRIASSSFDNTVQVWDALTGGNVLTYRGHTTPIHAVGWSPDSSQIVSGGGTYESQVDRVPKLVDTTVQVWNAVTGSRILTYHGHTTPIYAVAWSPDGKYIASGSDTYNPSGNSIGIMQVWNAVTGSHILTSNGHTQPVRGVAWSPDSKRIASGSDDQTVQVWDALTEGNAFTYNGHNSSPVYAVAWSPDGKYIASGYGEQNNEVQVWQAS